MVATFSALPQELLLDILRRLPPKQRHKAAPTCRLWHQLVQRSRGGEQVLVRGGCATLAGFQAWLQRGGLQHVRRLQLSPLVRQPGCGTKEEVEAQLHSVLRVLSGGGGLAELELRLTFDLKLGASLGLPSSLQRATLVSRSAQAWVDVGLSVEEPLHSVTGLQYLRLGDQAAEQFRYPVAVRFGPAAALPPSLTQLVVSPQVSSLAGLQYGLSGLTSLERLELDCRNAEPRDLDAATMLPRLTRLHLSLSTTLPPWLARLGSSLQHLRALSRCGADAAAIDGGLLAQLSRLTCLDLHLRFERRLQALPLAGGALPNLARLRFEHLDEGWRLLAPVETRLPGGPWLASIRELDLPAELVAPNLDLLSSARLEQVLVSFKFSAGMTEEEDKPMILRYRHADDLADDQVDELCALLAWAATHPNLSQLHFCNLSVTRRSIELLPALAAAIAEVREHNPRLVIMCRDGLGFTFVSF